MGRKLKINLPTHHSASSLNLVFYTTNYANIRVMYAEIAQSV